MAAPRTWGDATRRHGHVAQSLLIASRRTRDPSVATHYKALAIRALDLLADMEREPSDAPYVGRFAAAPCPTPACPGVAWVDARALHESAPSIAGQLWCPSCSEHRPLTLPEEVPVIPLQPDEVDELVQAALARVVELDARLFADPATLLADHELGRLQLWAHAWKVALADLVHWLGPEAAAEALREAREAAGTAVLLESADDGGGAENGDGEGDGDGDHHEVAAETKTNRSESREQPPDEARAPPADDDWIF